MNGLLVLDKPAGMTSHDVVNRVRRATGEKSIGHLGTLDPMATGVLPLLLGKWTRLAQFFSNAEKAYTGEIRFGFATDTYDAEGEPAASPRPLTQTLQELCALASRFRGEIEQMPPPFSAKKINGVPAHKLARAGKEVPVKPARVTVNRFELIEMEGETVRFVAEVSAGGYIRSLAHDLGTAAGCGAHLTELRRTRAGVFTFDQAMSLETMEALAARGELEAALPHPRTVLSEMPSVTADLATAGRLRNGMAVNLPEFSNAPLVKVFEGQRHLIAIGKRIAGTLMQPIVVIG
ncbi:tRNA pseudouridine(55) synthase TruB [Terriglobus albidus]|uniref:tRNA pseudouridine synthase B n=1 Tax=Terriglobus albidus TaxID=1592106 RepID=A0A5B9EDF9_9BACT|nr:tRNA pseudouridine(55) synthase TruB [Terriglobus albidus]QEE29684.1 tRNA pseudouridine(55) synthase TruB [Terriglobus albidus]